MAGLYSHTTRAAGLTLTANIYNGDHQNHINNQVPAQMDDYSVSVAEMKTTTDPFSGGTESQSTTLAGELERLRYQLALLTGGEWYHRINQSDQLVLLNRMMS